MNKYDVDMEAIDLKIQIQKNDYQNQLDKRLELEDTVLTYFYFFVSFHAGTLKYLPTYCHKKALRPFPVGFRKKSFHIIRQNSVVPSIINYNRSIMFVNLFVGKFFGKLLNSDKMVFKQPKKYLVALMSAIGLLLLCMTNNQS